MGMSAVCLGRQCSVLPRRLFMSERSASLEAGKGWTIVSVPKRHKAGWRWGPMESLWGRNKLFLECRHGIQRMELDRAC